MGVHAWILVWDSCWRWCGGLLELEVGCSEEEGVGVGVGARNKAVIVLICLIRGRYIQALNFRN